MPIFGTVSSGTPLGFKNLIINGNFDIWQRATSTTYNNTTGYPAADRWLGTTNGGVNVVYSRQAGGFDQNGKTNSYRVQRAAGSSGRFYLTQMMETSVLDFCRGKTVTLSYWAKRGSDFGATDLVVRIATQTDQTPREDGAVQNTDNTPSLTTSWQKFSHTFTLTSTSDSASGFKVEFIAERAGGTNVWYEVAQVQLEIGNVATTFETRPIGLEFALCQRYYFSPLKTNTGTQSATYQITYSASAGSSGWTVFQVPFPVSMRVAPTLTHNISDSNNRSDGGPSGTQWAFYVQNQGYASKQGSENANVFNGASTLNHCQVGAYYVSPTGSPSGIIIGNNLTFEFSAEL
jgi:hypothetical protein